MNFHYASWESSTHGTSTACLECHAEPGVRWFIEEKARGTEQLVAHFAGKVADTHLGLVMFESDRLMKNLSLGKDNVTGKPVTAHTPGHKTELEWALQFFDQSQVGRETWHRFWFVVEKVDLQASADRREIAFQTVKLKVNTECLDSNLKPLRDCNNASANAFAEQLSRQYDAYAAEYPVLRELIHAAKWVSIAKWLQDINAPVDLAQLSLSLAPVKTPLTTPAITVSAQEQTGNAIRTVTLYGGVNLSLENTYITQPPSSEPTLGQEALKARPGLNPVWRFLHRGQEQRAIAISAEPVKRFGTNRLVAPGLGNLGLTYDSFNRRWDLALAYLHFPQPKRKYDIGELYPTIELVDPATGERKRFLGPYKTSQGQIVYRLQEEQLDLELAADGRLVQKGPKGMMREFDPAGRILKEQNTDASQTVFSYRGDVLSTVEGKGQRVNLTYDVQGRLQEMSDLTSQVRRFKRNAAGQLEVIENERGQVLARYIHGADGQLSEERDGQDRVTRQYVYDESARVLADWSESGYRLYDWDAPQPTVRFIQTSGWRELAAPEFRRTFLSDLVALRRLTVESWWGEKNQHTLYLRVVGGRALLMVDQEIVELPASVARDAKALRAELERRGLAPRDGALLIANGDSQDLLFEEVFPGKPVLYAERLDIGMISTNGREVYNVKPPRPEDTSIIAALPGGDTAALREQLTKLQLDPSEASAWQGIREQWQQMVRTSGFAQSLSDTPSSARIEQSLQERAKTLVLVAHSDGKTMYLPDGSRFEPDKLSPSAQEAIRRNRPVVILIGCQLAKIHEGGSFARRLLELGASAVIAAPGEVGAQSTTLVVERFLFHSKQSGTRTLIEAWFKALQDVLPLDPKNRNLHLFISRGQERTPTFYS